MIQAFRYFLLINLCALAASCGSLGGAENITAAVLQTIAVTPANPSIAKGSTNQFIATGTYSDGTSVDLSASVIWSSDITTVATVNVSGLATGAGVGAATIKAASGVISGSTTLTVTESGPYKMSFSDDYSGGLSAWTQADGTWSVADGYLQGSPSGQSINIYYNTSTTTTSQWIQAKFKNMHDSDSMGMILWARDLSFTSQLYCLYNAGTFFVGYNDLQKKDHNYSPSCRYTLADGHYVGFEASGTPSGVTMKIYDNGTSPAPRPWSDPICTWTDLDASEYTYGKYVGLWIYHKTSNYSYDVFGPVNGGDQ